MPTVCQSNVSSSNPIKAKIQGLEKRQYSLEFKISLQEKVHMAQGIVAHFN